MRRILNIVVGVMATRSVHGAVCRVSGSMFEAEDFGDVDAALANTLELGRTDTFSNCGELLQYKRTAERGLDWSFGGRDPSEGMDPVLRQLAADELAETLKNGGFWWVSWDYKGGKLGTCSAWNIDPNAWVSVDNSRCTPKNCITYGICGSPKFKGLTRGELADPGPQLVKITATVTAVLVPEMRRTRRQVWDALVAVNPDITIHNSKVLINGWLPTPGFEATTDSNRDTSWDTEFVVKADDIIEASQIANAASQAGFGDLVVLEIATGVGIDNETLGFTILSVALGADCSVTQYDDGPTCNDAVGCKWAYGQCNQLSYGGNRFDCSVYPSKKECDTKTECGFIDSQNACIDMPVKTCDYFIRKKDCKNNRNNFDCIWQSGLCLTGPIDCKGSLVKDCKDNFDCRLLTTIGLDRMCWSRGEFPKCEDYSKREDCEAATYPNYTCSFTKKDNPPCTRNRN